MRIAMILAASAVLSAAGAARADEWSTGADLRCVVAFSALMNNPTYREAAASGIFYFVGRLEGRDPALDLGKGLKQVRSVMQVSQYAGEAQRCGAELKAKNEALRAMSSPLAQKRGVGN